MGKKERRDHKKFGGVFWRKIDVGKRRLTVANDGSDQNSDRGGGWFKCLKQVKRVNS